MGALLERFTTPHNPGELLQALHPRLGWRLAGGRSQGTIDSVTATGIDAAAVRIRPPRGWRPHVPGQFITIGVDVDGVRHSRSFTVTSLPGERFIEVIVQSSPTGVVSRHLVGDARPGDVIQLDEPAGDFVLGDPAEPLLLVSGGSGITPMLAMLRWLAVEAMTDCAPRPDVVMVHHASAPAAVLQRDEVRALDAAMPWLTVHEVTTRDESGGRLVGTHLDAARLESMCPDWAQRRSFVCGPYGMLEFARAHWAGSGHSDRLELEAFGAPEFTVPADGVASFRASFERTGTTTDAGAGETLLDVAESAGLAPKHGCRMGICRSCSTAVCSGRARDLRDGSVIDSGSHVQICISAAATDISLDL